MGARRKLFAVKKTSVRDGGDPVEEKKRAKEEIIGAEAETESKGEESTPNFSRENKSMFKKILKTFVIVFLLIVGAIVYMMTNLAQREGGATQAFSNIESGSSAPKQQERQTPKAEKKLPGTAGYPAAAAGAFAQIEGGSQEERPPAVSAQPPKHEAKHETAVSEANDVDSINEIVKQVPKRIVCRAKKNDDILYYLKEGGKLIPCYKTSNWNGKGISLKKGMKFTGTFYYSDTGEKFIETEGIYIPYDEELFSCKK